MLDSTVVEEQMREVLRCDESIVMVSTNIKCTIIRFFTIHVIIRCSFPIKLGKVSRCRLPGCPLVKRLSGVLRKRPISSEDAPFTVPSAAVDKLNQVPPYSLHRFPGVAS